MSPQSLLDQFPLLFGLIDQAASSGCDMDWKETPEAHIFKFDLPGLSKEDLKLELHGDRVLHLRGNWEKNEENCSNVNREVIKWHCKERPEIGNFCREFRLPDDALLDQIKASMRDGVLEITVLKDQSKLKKKIVKGNNKHHKKIVDVDFSGDDHENAASAPKGISRFVCCKA